MDILKKCLRWCKNAVLGRVLVFLALTFSWGVVFYHFLSPFVLAVSLLFISLVVLWPLPGVVRNHKAIRAVAREIGDSSEVERLLRVGNPYVREYIVGILHALEDGEVISREQVNGYLVRLGFSERDGVRLRLRNHSRTSRL